MSWKDVYQLWLNEETLDSSLKQELIELKDNETQLHDAFYAPLEFGTAGMRGILGAGINRMNIYTVRQATEGLALFIENAGAEAKRRGVAIAYDSRHFSPEFAMEAAKVLAQHHIKAYVFESLRPTPELSFAVRHLNTFAGIMITASHNPANYNGFKIYGEDGGQMPPADAQAVTDFVRSVKNPLMIDVLPEEAAQTSDLISVIGEEVDSAYLAEVKTVTINQALVKEAGKDLKLVFTPLHGAGKMLGEKALSQAGFEQFIVEPSQAVADPNFSTVASPNPEEHTAFEYAMRLGAKEGADLLIATDPDADRLGAAVRLPDGSYQVLTGNQLGALMLDYILAAHAQAGTLPENAVALKSIVSSELATAVAENYNVGMLNVLTGFKFIAEKIQQFEETNEQTFMFGFEESYGYLIKPFVRDKDAIQALVLLAEVAAYYKQMDKNLYDALQDVFAKYGFFAEKTISVTLSGAEGSAKIAELMGMFREKAPQTFAGIAVTQTEDFKALTRTMADGSVTTMTTPPSDVLKYVLTDGSWIAVRPSGTEPKIKFYIGVRGASQAAADEKIVAIEQAINEITGL